MSNQLLISDARQLLPRNNGRLVHIHTIRRWIAKGLKVNGGLVRLKSERVGARLMTRPEWIDEFIRECSCTGTEPVVLRRRSNGKSSAERFLVSEGFYGNEAREQMFGKVRPTSSRQRAVPRVSESSTLRNQNQQSDRGRVDRDGIDAAEVCGAAI